MRAAVIGIVVAAAVGTPGRAAAQSSSAAGSVGVGLFGDEPATTVDVGFDVAGEDYAIGFGGRLRFLARSGLRTEEWDEPSELASLVRYAAHRSDPYTDGPRVSLAVGELGGARLGHGALVDDYATGIDVDHRRLGAQFRIDQGAYGGEAIVDDLVAPRVAGLRGRLRAGELSFAVTAAADFSAPTMDHTVLVPAVVVDAEYADRTDDGRYDGRLYTDLVGIVGAGAGVHLGAAGSVAVTDAGSRLGLRAEARGGTNRYVPGWFGPLYERLRPGRLALARAGGLGGVGGMAEARLDIPGLAAASASYARRAGLPDLLAARLSAPYFRGAQAAVRGAAELPGRSLGVFAVAGELRARLPSRLFVVLEAAHLYRDAGTGYSPLWTATAAVGGVVGE